MGATKREIILEFGENIKANQQVVQIYESGKFMCRTVLIYSLI